MTASNHRAETPPTPAEQPDAPSREQGFDLMRVGVVRKMLLWSGFPRVFQWVLLAVVAAVGVITWGDFTPTGINSKLYAKTHLGTLLVWGLWWPAMVWAAVWFGRAWCAVCPVELVGYWSERVALMLGRRGRPLPPLLVAGALILALYVGLQLLVFGVQLHRVPAYTSWFLLALLGLAVLAGFFFRDRAFCRGFCPVGLLLGTYGRSSLLAVRPGAKTAANACAGPDARACPSLLNPSRLDSNAHCLVCVQCFKGAAPGSMRLELRRPFPPTDRREPLASGPVTGFVMVASGFVLSELCSEWPAAKKLFVTPPQWLTLQSGWSSWAGWFEGIWTLGVVPLVLWLTLGGLLRLSGEKAPLPQLWQRLALPAAVVIAAGHMSKGLAKFVSWLPHLPGAWRDPDGVDTARAITQKTITVPAPWLSLPTVSWLGLVLVSAAAIFAVREYRLARRNEPGSLRGALPLGLLAAFFGALVFGWRLA